MIARAERPLTSVCTVSASMALDPLRHHMAAFISVMAALPKKASSTVVDDASWASSAARAAGLTSTPGAGLPVGELDGCLPLCVVLERPPGDPA